MTKSEAISQLQERIDLINKDYFDLQLDKYAEALQMAIEALHQFAEDSKKVSSSCSQENDMVYRQAVIDDLDEWIDIYGENKCVDAQDILKQAKRSIKKLPSAQPKRTIKRTETRACDCISRQAAIDVLYKNYILGRGDLNEVLDHIVDRLEKLPSAQPEIICCKECEYGEQDEVGRWYCRSLGCQIGSEDGSGYCADAERRNDERSD